MANLSLSKTLETYIDDQVKGGYYNNRSEVVRDALRKQIQHDTKLAALRRDIDAGMQSIENSDFSYETTDSIMKEAIASFAKTEASVTYDPAEGVPFVEKKTINPSFGR